MTTRKRYEIKDSEWERLKAYFPERQDGQLGIFYLGDSLSILLRLRFDPMTF